MAANPSVIPQPLEGRVLLGWFERDMAVRYLTQACVFDPPITDAEAEAMWRPYRDRCEALSERGRDVPRGRHRVTTPITLPLGQV